MGYDGTLKFDTKVDSTGFQSGVSKIGSLAGTAMKATTAIISGAATAIGGLGTFAIKSGSEFEASMSNVAAISGATGSELDSLTAKAQEMGAKTKFSASESADAFSYMAMAGWKTEDMLNGIEGIMNLAAASGEDLATTSDIVTDALTAFGLSAQDSGHFADVLAAASSNANTNVGLMGETFKYVAPVAGALGFSAEDTALAIGLMANAGIKGSQAGTALRSTFSRLAKPTKEVQTALDALGVSLTDDSGNVKDLSTLLGDLRGGFANLTDAEKAQYAAMISGQQGMSGLLAIVNASEGDYNKLAEAIAGSTDELTGYSAAEEMAAIQLDNLQGQITILKSALEGFGIKVYQEMDGPLKEVVKTAQDMVQQLTDAFDEGGFEGLVSAVGDVLSQIVTKVADAAPKFIDMAVSLVHSFCEGLVNAPDIGTSGAQVIASLVNGIMSVSGDIATTAIYLFTEFVVGLQSQIPSILQTGNDLVLNVINGITSALPQLIPAAINIISSIADSITANLPLIIDAAFQLINVFIEEIVKALPEYIAAAIQVVNAFVDGIIQALPMLIDAAIEIVMALIDGLSQATPQLLDAAVKLLSAIIEAIPTVISKILSALPALIKAIVNFLTSNISEILQAGIELLHALIDAIPEIIPILLNNLPAIIVAIVGGILQGIPDILGAVIQVVGAVIAAIPELLVGIVAAIGEWFGGLLVSLGEWLASVWQSVADWFAELPAKIGEFFTNLIADIGAFFSQIIADAATFISNLAADIGVFLTDLPYKIGYALGEAIGKIIQWGSDVVSWVATNVPIIIENIVNFFKELPGKIWNWLKEAYNKVVQWGSETLSKAKEAASNTVNGVVQFFSELPGKVWSWLSNTISKVVSFATDLVNRGKTAASNFVNGMITTVSSLPSRMFSIGADIVNGVWRGIQSMASTFWSNVKSFFSGIVDGVKSSLGIKSPSKVFAKEVGQWIPPGVGEGVKKAMPKLIDDVNKSMDELSKAWTMDDVHVAMSMAVGIKAPDTSYDLDGDGKVTSADARLIQRAFAGLEDAVSEMTETVVEQAKWTMEDVRNAMRMSVGLDEVDLKYDVDDDGKVTSADARLIQRSFAGLEKTISDVAESANKEVKWDMGDVRDAMRMSIGLDKEDLKYDVDKDGKVTSADARLIQRAFAGLEEIASMTASETAKTADKIAEKVQAAVKAETNSISYDKTGQSDYEQAQKVRTSAGVVKVTGQLEGDQPIVVHTNLYIDKTKFAEEITPAINHEMYKIDHIENDRGKGN